MIRLQFDGDKIKGDSITAGHEKWITIDSIQWGVGRSISARAGGTDRETSNPSHSEITFAKSADIASTALMAQATGGLSLKKATIHFLNTHENKPQIYMQIDLHEPIVSSYSASSGGDRPSESFSLNFTKIVTFYKQFDGAKEIAQTIDGWDLGLGEVFVKGKMG